MDERNDVHVEVDWPVNESPHVVTDVMGGLLAAVSAGALDLHVTDAVRRFGMEHDRRALTQHVLTHCAHVRQQMKEAHTSYIKPSEVFDQ